MTRNRTVCVATAGVLLASLVAVPGAAARRPKCGGKRATIVGTKRGERISGTRRADVIHAGGGNDLVFGLRGNDFLCGGAGADQLQGGPGNDRLAGQKGADTLFGLGQHDVLKGGPGTDDLIGGPGNDRLVTGGGLFHLVAPGPGNNTAIGGRGFDILTFEDLNVPINADLAAGTITHGRGSTTAFFAGQQRALDGLRGSPMDDTIFGTNAPYFDFIDGDDGNDTIDARSGGTEENAEIVTGGLGTNTIAGGEGVDLVWESYLVGIILGGACDEAERVTLDLQLGGSQAGSQDVRCTSPNAMIASNTLFGIEGAIGSPGNNTLHGDGNDNFFDLSDGNNTADGGGGIDTVKYGLTFGTGVTVDLGAGTGDDNDGTSPDTFTGFENVWGSNGDDVLTGNDFDNRIWGFAGDDDLFGLGGNDNLWGGIGMDRLFGSDGDDYCEDDPNDEFDSCEAFGGYSPYRASLRTLMLVRRSPRTER